VLFFFEISPFFLSPFPEHRGLGYQVTTFFLNEKYPSPAAKSTSKALLCNVEVHCLFLVPKNGPPEPPQRDAQPKRLAGEETFKTPKQPKLKISVQAIMLPRHKCAKAKTGP
jgi:hypothetical protein